MIGAALILALATPAPAVTFNRDVAPILFERCSACHRPGGAGPFPLLTYDDARKRAKQIAEVTGSRYMPPWLPEPTDAPLEGERRLDDEQVGLLRQWYLDGAAEGDPADLPPRPEWPEGWQLGTPDLVVQLPTPYTLPADAVDVFRNFVVALPVDRVRYVRAVELRPGNPRIVHHGVFRIDRTRSSRMLDAREPGAGFGEMNMGDSVNPNGGWISWTPGAAPDPGDDRLAWKLYPGTDAVLQLHMLPTGKPETIQPTIGLFFTDDPPTHELFGLMLRAREIDIPPGESHYVVEDSYELPVALRLYDVYPHAHYLGKRMLGWAELPDGSTVSLLRIEDWDFNWQGAYRFESPPLLPAGSTLHMRFVYDNSADNVRNPNRPPIRVRSGERSFDEMGTLSFEVLPATHEDLEVLRESVAAQDVAKDPEDWVARQNLGLMLSLRGELQEAERQYREVLRLNPTRASAMCGLADVLKAGGRWGEAGELLAAALRLNPSYAAAHGSLGALLSARGQYQPAVFHLRRALEIDRTDGPAFYNLGLTLARLGRVEEAIAQYREALRIEPEMAGAHNNLANALSTLERADEAVEHYRRALEIDPDMADAHANLGNALLMRGEVDEAIRHYERALRFLPDSPDLLYNLEQAQQIKAELER